MLYTIFVLALCHSLPLLCPQEYTAEREGMYAGSKCRAVEAAGGAVAMALDGVEEHEANANQCGNNTSH